MPCSSHLLRSGIFGQNGSTLYTGAVTSFADAVVVLACCPETATARQQTPVAIPNVRANPNEIGIVARESSTAYPSWRGLRSRHKGGVQWRSAEENFSQGSARRAQQRSRRDSGFGVRDWQQHREQAL